MASTWLDIMRSQLDKTQAKAAVVKGKSIYDIANAVTNAPSSPFTPIASSGGSGSKGSSTPQSTWDSYNLLEKLGHSDTLANIMGNEQVASVIDKISRPVYGVNSVLFDASQQNQDLIKGGNKSTTLNDVNWSQALDKFGKGFSGETKHSFKDVVDLEHPDTQPGVNDAGDWQRALFGFAGDVAVDPLTYIPGGKIVNGTKFLGAKAGIKGPQWVKNGVQEAVLQPEQQTANMLEAFGKTSAPTNIADKLVNDSIKKPLIEPVYQEKTFAKPPVVREPVLPGLDTLGKPRMNAPVADGAVAADTASHLPDYLQALPFEAPLKKAPGSSDKLQGVLLNAQRDSQKSILEGVATRKYNPADITSPFKNIPEAVVETPGVPLKDAVMQNAAQRVIRDNPEKFGLVAAKDGGVAFKDGTPVVAEMAGMVDKLVAQPDKWKHFTIKAQGSSAQPITAQRYIDSLSTGKTEAVPGVTIPQHGKPVDYKQFIADKHNKYALNEMIPTSSVTKAASVEKISGAEKKAWQESLKNVLAPEDYKYLTAGAHQQGNFTTRLNKVLGKVSRTNFDSLDSLEAAVKAGTTPKSALDRALKTYGAKTVAGAKTRAAQLDARIAKHEAKTTSVEPAAMKAGSEAPQTPPGTPQAAEQAAQVAPAPVVKAADIVEAARNGDTAMLDKIPASLSEVDKAGVMSSIKSTMEREFTKLDKYIFESATGTLRTSQTLGEGLGRNAEGFNKFSALSLHSNIINDIKGRVGAELKALGPMHPRDWHHARRSMMYDTYMPMLQASEDTLKKYGIIPHLGKDSTGIPLSMHDILSTMDRATVEKFLMSQKNVYPTKWMDAAEVMVKGTDAGVHPAEILPALVKALGSGNQIKELARDFMSKGDALVQKVEVNRAAHGIEAGMQTKRIELESIKKFSQDLEANMSNPSALLGMVDHLDNYVTVAVKEGKVIPPVGAAEAAGASLTDAAAAALPVAEMQVVVKGAKQFAKAGANVHSVMATRSALLDNALHNLHDIVGPVMYETTDVSEKLVTGTMLQMVRAIFPNVANKDLRTLLLQDEISAKGIAGSHGRMLNNVARKHDKATLVEAFKHVQQGGEATGNAAMDAAIVDMKTAIGFSFDTVPEVGVMARNGIDPRHVNRHFDSKGIPDKYKLVGKDKNAALDSWKTWTNVDDPLDLLSRAQAAITAAHAENLLGTQLNRFGKTTPFKGSVKLVGQPSKNSVVWDLVNRDLYYSRDIADQMRVLDTTLQELLKPPSTNKALKIFDAATHVYKTHLTVYRLGHHMRNMYGDIWLGAMDGLYNPRYYKDAMTALATRKANYVDWKDVNLAGPTGASTTGKTLITFTHNGKKIPMSADDVYRMAKTNGIFSDYTTVEDLAITAQKEGIDLTQSGINGKLSKFNPVGVLEAATGGAIKKGDIFKAATKTSELRDHYVKLAHFIYALEKHGLNIKGATLEDALAQAAEKASARTRKWHPDGGDKSQFERGVLSRTVLFYSWLRKAIPLVLESTMTTPGRVTVFPKAMYAMAEANGIDLQNGFGDPFPTDQLFPDWMKNTSQGPTMGVAGAYFGAKPGLPSDVLDQYFNLRDPGATVKNTVSALNPVIKDPIEMYGAVAQGKGNVAIDSRTGAPVKTWTDYITNQVPNSGLIGNLSGVDPLGSSPDPTSNDGYSPQLDMPGGVTLDNKGIAGLNWLTGLGIGDMSKPSYIAGAQKQNQKKTMDAAKARYKP